MLEGCGRKRKAYLISGLGCLPLASLAAAETDDLAVLLQLRNQLVTLLDDVVVSGIPCQ
jgi:hypothetical protein